MICADDPDHPKGVTPEGDKKKKKGCSWVLIEYSRSSDVCLYYHTCFLLATCGRCNEHCLLLKRCKVEKQIPVHRVSEEQNKTSYTKKDNDFRADACTPRNNLENKSAAFNSGSLSETSSHWFHYKFMKGSNIQALYLYTMYLFYLSTLLCALFCFQSHTCAIWIADSLLQST